MTYWIILVMALALSLISLRYRNILFALGGTLGWIALWAYHQSNPPAGVSVGSFVHEVMYYAFIVMAIAVMFVYFKNRDRGYTGYPTTKSEEVELDQRRISRRPARGLMDLSPTEYRAVIRSKMRHKR